jgi:2-aminoethylphosphonate-pyruvate transaminase
MREWVLLNPGPANTSTTVRQALLMPDLCHREPECFDMVRSIRDRLVRLAGGGDLFSAVLLTGSGTASVEAVLASAVPLEGALLVVDNGVYGDRMARIARAHRIPVHLISRDVTTPIEPAAVDSVLAWLTSATWRSSITRRPPDC